MEGFAYTLRAQIFDVFCAAVSALCSNNIEKWSNNAELLENLEEVLEELNECTQKTDVFKHTQIHM